MNTYIIHIDKSIPVYNHKNIFLCNIGYSLWELICNVSSTYTFLKENLKYYWIIEDYENKGHHFLISSVPKVFSNFNFSSPSGFKHVSSGRRYQKRTFKIIWKLFQCSHLIYQAPTISTTLFYGQVFFLLSAALASLTQLSAALVCLAWLLSVILKNPAVKFWMYVVLSNLV